MDMKKDCRNTRQAVPDQVGNKRRSDQSYGCLHALMLSDWTAAPLDLRHIARCLHSGTQPGASVYTVSNIWR